MKINFESKEINLLFCEENDFKTLLIHFSVFSVMILLSPQLKKKHFTPVYCSVGYQFVILSYVAWRYEKIDTEN